MKAFYVPAATNSATVADMRAHMLSTQADWNSNSINFTGAPLNLVDGGTPAELNLTFPYNDATSALTLIKSAIVNQNKRGNADLIVVFASELGKTGSNTLCGSAGPSAWNNWSGSGANFTPSAATGYLDVRNKDSAYVVVVSALSGCFATRVVLHEIGHLTGAGHFSGNGNGLFSDSKPISGYHTPPGSSSSSSSSGGGSGSGGGGCYPYDCQEPQITTPGITNPNGFVTVMGYNSQCPQYTATGQPCSVVRYFSNGAGLYGSSTANNLRAINQTALSVANYRFTAPATPYLVPPKNIRGYNRGCDSGWTKHDLYWDEGGSTAAVTFFQLWYWQVDPYWKYGWDILAPIEYTPVYVIGANSTVRLRTCNTTNCSVFAPQTYLATWNSSCLYH